MIGRVAKAIAAAAPLILELGALGALAYGCFRAWAPLGFIVPGAIVLALCIMADLRRGAPDGNGGGGGGKAQR